MRDDMSRLWARMRGKEDPLAMVGETNDREVAGDSNYVWSLKNINFDIQQGDIVGVIGRNGAGKSTLLKILSKVTAPTTGSIKIKGRIASLLEVGTGFHPELTGRENIYLNGAILGMRKHEITRKLDEIIAFAGVERYVDTPVKRYSSGMYVRLAFAVAAHLESEIMIIDEVLAVGDAEFQKKCLGKMGDVSKSEGRTILFVSHNIDAIYKICKSGILLQNGQIIHSGDKNTTISTYKNLNKKLFSTYVNDNINKLYPCISKVYFGNGNNNTFINGQKLCVNIELYTPFPIDCACLSFQIVDQNEKNCVHAWVFDEETPFCREPGTYQLSCTIDNFRLYMGNYYLKVYFTEKPGGRIFEIIDLICPFEVAMYETERILFNFEPNTCVYTESFTWNAKKI